MQLYIIKNKYVKLIAFKRIIENTFKFVSFILNKY